MEGHPSVPEMGKLPSDFHHGRKLVTFHVILRRKAQAEEVGGKGYLILHYSFLILGLKWPPPHKIALKCMKPQTLFPFPPRNVPCNSSGTSTVSEGERVAEVQGKGGNHFKPKNVSKCRLPEFSPELTSAAFAC